MERLRYGDEENGRCACTNGNSTTADQSEIRKVNLVSVLSDKYVAGKGGYAWMDKKNKMTDKNIKNIKIKTTGGTTVNIACSYAEDKTLEALLLSL